MKKIWIAWERQRRSVELANHFKCNVFFITKWNKYWFRLVGCTIATIITIRKQKPDILFVQNPSIFLAAICCFLKPFFSYVLVVDRHSNFKFEHRNSINPKWCIFHLLSKYTLKKSDFTIVTNKYLKKYIVNQGATALVLSDKIPDLKTKNIQVKSNPNKKRLSAFVISSFQKDEPYEEIFHAAKNHPDITFIFSGNYKKVISPREISNLPKNVVLAGFITESEYAEMLSIADFTLVFTKHEFILNCGSYESISAGKPMILSNTITIRNFFKKGAIYCEELTGRGISEAITQMKENLGRLNEEIRHEKPRLKNAWETEVGIALSDIDQFVNSKMHKD